MTQETKNKISESMKRLGLKPPSRSGRKCSEETKKKMRLSNIGKKRSQYTKDKMSKTRTGRIGKLCNSWNGGVSKECEKIRGSREYLFWRKSCIDRDNFTCQISGQSGGKLHIHHINNFTDYPELRFEISNGITLSEEIHKIFHKLYGRNNNTLKQLEEFKNNLIKTTEK